ncbi:MAG: hypothetical protein WC846_03585 [Candidatus Gracilibacteria bacterium]
MMNFLRRFAASMDGALGSVLFMEEITNRLFVVGPGGKMGLFAGALG